MIAFRRLLSQKLLWIEETALMGAILGSIYVWLGLPVATTLNLVEHALLILLILGLLWVSIWLANRAFGRVQFGKVLKLPAFWISAVITLVVGFVLPYYLIWWIPDLGSMTAQAVSAAIRFLIAGLLFTGAMLWLHCTATT
ncbi:hypothetical protein [uncultured Paludibaculum sp.]|uniref:hypothetical protein n=1 Tax=uncultured Paludibaculum sp. TaxID=1765020 RepID=UPI002AAB43F4|nr:hypothetical protein [uncultured Paludibaculum sp.]